MDTSRVRPHDNLLRCLPLLLLPLPPQSFPRCPGGPYSLMAQINDSDSSNHVAQTSIPHYSPHLPGYPPSPPNPSPETCCPGPSSKPRALFSQVPATYCCGPHAQGSTARSRAHQNKTPWFLSCRASLTQLQVAAGEPNPALANKRASFRRRSNQSVPGAGIVARTQRRKY